jgi:hypothetical protein
MESLREVIRLPSEVTTSEEGFMSDEPQTGEPEVYVPPTLAEAGAFADETQGWVGVELEGPGTYMGPWL